MPNRPRLILIAGLSTTTLLCVLLALVGPIRISISLARGESPVAAAPRQDLPTTTPVPPTSTGIASTATPIPTSTAVPSTSTAVPTSTSIAFTPTPIPTGTIVAPTPVAPTPVPAQPPRRLTEPPPTPEPTEPSPGPVSAPPDLSIVKRADRPSAQPGDTVLFTLTARNHGSVTTRDVVITDAVPGAFEVIDLSSSKGDIVLEGQTVSAYPVTLASDETVVVRITTRVRATAEGGMVGNMAIITTSTPGDDPGNNTSTTTVTIIQLPRAITVNRLPVTAEPDGPRGFLAVYWPLMTLGCGLLALSALVRAGYLHARVVTLALQSGPARTQNARSTPVIAPPVLRAGIAVDPEELYRRWRDGASVSALSAELATLNPGIDPLVISIAVRQLIDESIRGG